jgi:type IV pilus assembly protein PilV
VNKKSFFSITGRSAGFTLLELLIAVTIFAVGLLTVAGMQVTAMQAGTTAQTQTVATALAQGVFEELMSLDADHPEFDSLIVAKNAHDPDSVVRPPAGPYQAVYSVTPDTPATGLARVDVHVTGNNRSVRLSGFKRTL